MNVQSAVGLLLCAIATVASIVSTAIPYWVSDSIYGQSEHYGLWEICIKTINTTSCTSYVSMPAPVPDWLKATQAMMILGILFLALSLFLGCLQYKYNSRLIFLGSILSSVLGGVVLIIAVIIFGVKEKEVKSHFSAGFYLALVAGVLAIFSAILMVVSKRGSTGYSSI